MNANRGFSAVLHARGRNTRNPLLFRDRAPSSNGYYLTYSRGRSRILFVRGNDSSFVYSIRTEQLSRLEFSSSSSHRYDTARISDQVNTGFSRVSLFKIRKYRTFVFVTRRLVLFPFFFYFPRTIEIEKNIRIDFIRR